MASSSTSSSTTSNTSPATALAPSAADGAHHPAIPVHSAADGSNLPVLPPTRPPPPRREDAWPALLDTIEPSKGVGRSTTPPATASASGASTSRSMGAAAASSRAAARLPTTTFETGWGSKGRVPPAATGLALLLRQRTNLSPRNLSSPGRGRGRGWKTAPDPKSSTRPGTCSSKNFSSGGRGSAKAAKGGYEGWEAAPDPTSSTLPKKAWGSPQLLTKFAGHDTSSFSAAGPSASTPAPAAPPLISVQPAPVQATPSSAPSLSDTFDWINSNYSGPGRGVLGAVPAAPAGGDAAVAADAFQNNDSWYASDRTVEDLRRQAATESASSMGTQFEHDQFPHGDILAQHGGFPGAVLGQATNAGRVLPVGTEFLFESGHGAPRLPSPGGDMIGLPPPRLDRTFAASPMGTQFERDQFPHGDILPQHGGFPGDVLGQATGDMLSFDTQFPFESGHGAPRVPSPGGVMMGQPPPRRYPEQDPLGWAWAEIDRLSMENHHLRAEHLETVLELRQADLAIDHLETRLELQAEARPERQPAGVWCFDCQNKPAEVPFIPCGHIRLCFDCYVSRQMCPSCMCWIEWIRLP